MKNNIDVLLDDHGQALLEAVGDGLVIVDPQGVVLNACGQLAQRL